MRIWQSLDLVATLAISLTIGALGMLDLADGPILAGATLATLGVLAAGALHSRFQISDLLRITRQSLVDPPAADRLLHPSTSGVDADLAGARTIDIVGVTLNRTVRNHATALAQCLRRGGTVRVAVIDPHGEVLHEAARRSTAPDTAELFAHRLRPTLDLLGELAAAGHGRIEVRLLDFVPAFGLLAAGDRLCVDIYSHTFGGPEPALTLQAGRDHIWYQHFRGEFEQIWAAGRLCQNDNLRTLAE
ncbi:hypothetical protein [Paractinoplanes durhamensis]|uniref:Uncharacterized protein n=1 Tax=Paractinoplanes durhamensis TaxID=113563 RepID=A0ABQ3ZB40_9ACTN|nr:hypothetical protein [Actinoplanes durhamensis]GIE07036.1 hypothetical protein Adu01nite_83860 [Actinoplanes durhamensis]